MIISIIILTFSFLLDGITSYYLYSSFTDVSMFNTIYTIIGLVIIYRFFSNNKNYLILCAIFGLLFDIVYTNTLLFNLSIFCLLGGIIVSLNNKLSINIINNSIISIVSIFSYYIITNIILVLINYIDFNMLLIYRILVNSIIMTIFYSIFSTLIIDKLDKKYSFKMVK